MVGRGGLENPVKANKSTCEFSVGISSPRAVVVSQAAILSFLGFIVAVYDFDFAELQQMLNSG